MGTSRLIFVLGLLFSISGSAQTIMAKFQLNPLHVQEVFPVILGTSIEVGFTPKSSLQISGLYRVDKTDYGVTKGPKYYLDYRYYFKGYKSTNRNYYISPFLGIGRLNLANEGDDFGFTKDHTLQEKFAGLLLGYQPYKTSRFTIDLYAGPEYQWRTEKYIFNSFVNQVPYQLTTNRVWFRAGLNFCFRIKK